MAAILTGNIVSSDGTTIPGIKLSSPQLKNLKSIYDTAIKSGQSPTEAFNSAASKVYTTDGNSLVDALQLAQTALNLHGGPANPNITSNIPQMVQSRISSKDLSSILNGGSGGMHYSSSNSSGGSSSDHSTLIIDTILIFLLVGFLFMSEPSSNVSKHHPGQETLSGASLKR